MFVNLILADNFCGLTLWTYLRTTSLLTATAGKVTVALQENVLIGLFSITLVFLASLTFSFSLLHSAHDSGCFFPCVFLAPGSIGDSSDPLCSYEGCDTKSKRSGSWAPVATRVRFTGRDS